MRKVGLFCLFTFAFLLIVMLAGCSRQSVTPQGTGDGTKNSLTQAQRAKNANRSIFVLAGAGMKKPMDEAGKTFTRKTGIKVEYTYAGSACLLAQIDNSRQGDCYMPGEKYYLDQAQKKGYLVKVDKIAYVIPVIAVAKGNPKHVKSLQDLVRKDVRVGIGEPHATALGKQAIVVLEKAGLVKQVKENVTLQASTVPELCNGIVLGHLDAAIVWDAVALWYPGKVDIIPIDPKYNAVSTVPLAILSFSKDPEAAKEFQAFVASDEGKAIFKKNGYSLTPESQFLPRATSGNPSQ